MANTGLLEKLDDTMIYFPTQDPAADYTQNYKYLVSGVVPRPIAWVLTRNHPEALGFNLAPFSFFNVVCASPMILGVSTMIRSSDGEKKDTLKNLEQFGECVVHIITEDLIEQANTTAKELPYGSSELEAAGLKTLESQIVKVPRLAAAKLAYEAVLDRKISYGDHVGGSTLLLLRVVAVHVDESVMSADGRIQTDLLKPVGRGAGMDWILCDHRRELQRPGK